MAKVLTREPVFVAYGRFSNCKWMWPLHFEKKENLGGTLARATSLYSLFALLSYTKNFSSIWREDVIDIDVKSAHSDPTHGVG